MRGTRSYFSSCNCVNGEDLITTVPVGTTDAGCRPNSVDQKVMERRKMLNHMIAAPSPVISSQNCLWTWWFGYSVKCRRTLEWIQAGNV